MKSFLYTTLSLGLSVGPILFMSSTQTPPPPIIHVIYNLNSIYNLNHFTFWGFLSKNFLLIKRFNFNNPSSPFIRNVACPFAISKITRFYLDMDIYLFYGGSSISFNIPWDIKLNLMASEKIHTHFLKIENIAARNFFYLHRKSAQVSHNSYFKQTLQEFFEVNTTRFNSILYCFNISYHTKKISAALCETNSTNSSEGLIIFFLLENKHNHVAM